MSDLIETLYCTTEENLQPGFLDDPEYQRWKEVSVRLEEEIADALGPGGKQQLDDLYHAQCGTDRFWRLAMFRQALAMGLELGRLPAFLTA
jgi:hypothetical protein